MAPRRKSPPRRAPVPPAIPRETSWIETDAWDRARFDELRRDSATVAALEERGRALLPHFSALLLDLFAALFKMNVARRDASGIAPSARGHAAILDGLLVEAAAEHLRERTELDVERAGLAACLLGERAIDLLREEKLASRSELLDGFDLARDEDAASALAEEMKATAELREDSELSDEARAALDALAKKLEREGQALERRVGRKAKLAEEERERRREWSGEETEKRLAAAALDVARVLDDATEEAESLGRAIGASGKGSASASLELGRRLARSEKLRKLSRLLGRMREQALALRRRMFERRNEEVFAVAPGREIARLLPQELVTLRHPVLGRDWRRRYVEGALLEHELRGADERGRGPMVVCLDVSSSMAGDKEVWAKAVTLTLLEIARRERRLFRAILFSSGEVAMRTFDLNRGDRTATDLGVALDLAEWFPGGGTDFERPLDAAVACLGESRFKKGDVVFVTDGESRVGEAWRERFLAEKKRLDFSLYAILIDVGPAAEETVRGLADRISRVTQLGDEGVRELFVEV